MQYITLDLTHRCPYKLQDVPVASCHINSEHHLSKYCYGCDVPTKLVQLYGLRTYRKQAVPEGSTLTGLRYVYVPKFRTSALSWLVVDLTRQTIVTLQTHARRKCAAGNKHPWVTLATKPELMGSPVTLHDGPQLATLTALARLASKVRGSDR